MPQTIPLPQPQSQPQSQPQPQPQPEPQPEPQHQVQAQASQPPHPEASHKSFRPPTPPRPSTAPPPQPQHPASQPDEIPALTSIHPAIYVPIPEGFFTFQPPSSPAEHHAAAITAIDSHAQSVKANIRALTKQECVRITRLAAHHEAVYLAQNPNPLPTEASSKGRLSSEDKRSMIANLEAPKEANLGKSLPSLPDFKAWSAATPEEWGEREVLATVSRTMHELTGYDEHVRRTKVVHEEALKREAWTATEDQVMEDVDDVV
ncbi:hypothetical protein QQS21_003641 [Conoideocrella luteorostrata]|uniref:Uncharacterized protein n=1 Tax=Conoideocrella luteorostrata TaxID=1105319 RepID=A0AAJ0G0D2_9HYPO|nr:hypothetical protein QQS21_003641 [Conoideocrella luteorostrata]